MSEEFFPDKDQRILFSRLRLAGEALGLALNPAYPADKTLEKFFRERRKMGSKDRGFVAETVYGCLRQLRLLATLAKRPWPVHPADSDRLVLAYALRFLGWQTETASAWALNVGLPADAASLDADSEANADWAVRRNLPGWLAERFIAQYGGAEADRLAAALNQAAPVDIRANILKNSREELAALLESENLHFVPCPYAPDGLRRQERAPLLGLQAFREGRLEVQDEGSQLPAYLLEAQPRERNVDFCAGAGGKTLQIAAAMQNSGALLAFDVAEKRLAQLKIRLRRAGLHNTRCETIAHENDARIKRLRGGIDRVFVDAPCSGSGTLRRNPDIKWRAVDLAELTALQERILQSAALLLKPGGRLVYATCSVLSEENENVVERFLANNRNFEQLGAYDILKRQRIGLNGDGKALKLLPHLHHTDGFFAAVFARKQN